MTAHLFLLLQTCCLAADPASDAAMDKAFEELGQRYVREFPEHSPVAATQLGDHRFDNRLDEISPRAREQAAAFYRKYLAELSKILPAKISRAHQVDYALLELSLRADLWRL